MKLTDKLRYLSEGLGSIGVTIHHYHRPLNTFPCIVWAEEGGDELHADNGVGEQAVSGTLDYFTHEEFDPTVDLIQEKLQEMGLAWGLNSVQYEEDTDLTHWEWVWEV